MKRTPPIKIAPLQMTRALQHLKLKQGLSRKIACKVIVEWLKTRAESSIPEGENLSARQLRATLRNIKRTLDRATDSILQAPKYVHHEIAIEYQRVPRFYQRVALTYPEAGMRDIIRTAKATHALSESISRTLKVYSSKGGPTENRGDSALLLDLAELYEWLTGEEPTRKTKSYKHTDTGKPFGEFYEFIRFFWFAYHKSHRGLDGAFKAWATQRNRGARKSQFLKGLLHHHPEWQ
jgi:hypothetical protein